MNTGSRTRATLITVVAAAALAGLAGCRIEPESAPPVVPQSPTPPATQTARPDPGTEAPPAAPASSPPAAPTHRPAPSADCRATDLAVDSIQSDGGSGSAFQTVTVENRGAACHLPGYPQLVYTDQRGVIRALPVTKPRPAPTGMLLRPDARAAFTIRTTNGYGGYDPTSPACAHPATYQKLAIQLGTGRVALSGLTLDVRCGEIDLMGWAPPTAA